MSGSTSAGWLKGYAVAIVSLLSGAAVVHNIYKPDLVRPRLLPCYFAVLSSVMYKIAYGFELWCNLLASGRTSRHLLLSWLAQQLSRFILPTQHTILSRRYPCKSLRRLEARR